MLQLFEIDGLESNTHFGPKELVSHQKFEKRKKENQKRGKEIILKLGQVKDINGLDAIV